MIGGLLVYLRRATGQYPSSDLDDTKWRTEFEQVFARVDKPRLLVEFVRSGIPSSLRGWTWCKILQTSKVPSTNLLALWLTV
jgi:hypothetical protein